MASHWKSSIGLNFAARERRRPPTIAELTANPRRVPSRAPAAMHSSRHATVTGNILDVNRDLEDRGKRVRRRVPGGPRTLLAAPAQ